MHTALFLFQISAISLCIAFWLQRLIAKRRHEDLVTDRNPDATPVGILDIGFTVAIWAFFQAVAAFLTPLAMGISLTEVRDLDASQMLEFSGWTMLLQLGATFLAIAYFLVRHKQVSWLGSRSTLMDDIRIGIIGFFMIVPLVMLVQFIATKYIPYTHLTLDSLKEDFSIITLAWAWVAAVGVAPITEEFFFRGIVQGFLQRIFDHDEPMDKLFAGGPVAAEYSIRDQSTHSILTQFRFWIPILISSALFAAMHIGQGPAPIPLFLLAIGLGYVFRKTGSWIPCVIIHFLLNFVSLTVFSLQIIYPELMPAEPVPAFAL